MQIQQLTILRLFGTAGAISMPQIVPHTMKKAKPIIESEEPIGIIISRGDRAEQRPVVHAFVWGPAPDPVTEPATKVA
jgi:hypothetical protein